MISIRLDGRDPDLHQWDRGQRLILEGVAPGTRVDFSYGYGKSEPEYTYEEDGVVYCTIRDSTLMGQGRLFVYVYLEEGDRGETIHKTHFLVNPRPKPSDYVEPEQIPVWSALQAQINELKDRPASVSAAADLAVNDPAAPGYVKNRTHWIDDPVEIATLLEAEVTEGYYSLERLIGIEEGETYLVTVDGVAYKRKCELLAGEDGGEPAEFRFIGNGAIMGATGNSYNDSFVVADLYNLSTGDQVSAVLFTDTETHTIKISHIVEQVHPLDPQHLPDTVPLMDRTVTPGDVILEETAVNDSTQLDCILVRGQTYIVTTNGTEHKRVCKPIIVAGASVLCVGNAHMINDEYPDTGEPFLVFGSAKGSYIIAPDQTVSIRLTDTVTDKIPEKCIPEHEHAIPEFDLVAMGLPAFVIDGEMSAIECDTTELMGALKNGHVKIQFKINGEDVIIAPIVAATRIINNDGTDYGYTISVTVCAGMGEVMDFHIMVSPGYIAGNAVART